MRIRIERSPELNVADVYVDNARALTVHVPAEDDDPKLEVVVDGRTCIIKAFDAATGACIGRTRWARHASPLVGTTIHEVTS